MTNYFQVLTTLEYLLEKAGEIYWRDWLRQDIDLWRSRKDVAHHLSAYGGMGSFNDIVIGVQNGHNVTKAQEPWVNNLFEVLKGLCFRLAHEPEKDESITVINSERYIPVFGAFKHGLSKEGIESAARQLSIVMSQLHGWRCLKCGYGETSFYDIENYLAMIFLPKYLSAANTEREFKALVDAAFALEFAGVAEARAQLRQMILNSGIQIVEREGWMRPCPKCGSDDTAVYRWELSNDILNASKDNLPLKSAAA